MLLANGKMYVNVPWTDSNTTYTQATSDNLGLVKIGYSANGKNYPVALDGNGKMYVNVPWTDTNTTYTNMGAAGEFVWSITISDVPANVTIEELTATLKVTAAGGQIANVTVTQASGDSTIELDKEIINLDVNGTQQTVNVTSNDSWTWAQAAARTVLRMMGR